MTVVFVRLKLRLLRNVLRTSAGPGLVVFSILAIGVGLAVGQALRWSSDLERFVVTPLLGAALVVSWALGPVLFGNSDETIDTTRLAPFPLDPDRLATGLAVQAMVGPGPIAALIALVGCHQGFRASGSAEAVGRLTTVSVVRSIFLVIVIDAAFSILFTFVGI